MAAHGNGVGISYSRPSGDICYDGQTLKTIPIITPEAEVDIKLIWSNLIKREEWFGEVMEVLG